jgi:transcription termination/antitermination protein NusA
MARKLKPKFDKQIIIDAFAEMARDKGIDRESLQEILKETLSMLVRKKYGNEANFDIVVNMSEGSVEIYMIRTVVEEVTDPVLEILQSDANQGVEQYDIGDDFLEEITLENIAESFGRRLVSMAGQTLNQRIRDVEKENVLNVYEQKVGEVVIAEVNHVRRSDVFLMHNGVELRLPREEQIPRERYRKGEPIRAIIKEVRRQTTVSGPDIIVSRSDNAFLARLFEIEIPEIYDGVIEIKNIAREPGERAKVAVQSYDDRIDPVGACVGMKGIRIHAIVRELDNENIDIINYSDEPLVFIQRSLSPAKVKDIRIAPETRTATVIVGDDQVSLAIGKNGQNVRLASRLTGFSISLVKEGGEDIELVEFRDELGLDVFNALRGAGIETAREFLNAEPARLLALPGLTKALLLELRVIMLEEFDEHENPDMHGYVMELADEAIAAAGAENAFNNSDAATASTEAAIEASAEAVSEASPAPEAQAD